MRRLCLLCAVARGAAVSMPRLIEAKLARAAVPLAASVDAAADLRSRGVARIDGVLPARRCAALRLHCGALAERSPDPEAAKWAAWMGAADARYVPGTRLRFGDALEQRLERHRRDVLLPVEDRLVRESLGEAAAAVRGALRGAAGCLPGGGRGGGLELVECGLLASTFGAGREKRAKNAKFPISVGFHSLRLSFGRAIISRSGLEASMFSLERARAELSR